MNNIDKKVSILVLIVIDFISINLATYLSATAIESSNIKFLNLFFYFSFVIFLFLFLINFFLKNYLYLNRSFGFDNIKRILISSLIIFILILIFKLFISVLGIELYFYDTNFFSLNNIISIVLIFTLISIIFRYFISELSNGLSYSFKNKKNKYGNFVLYGAGRSGISYVEFLTRNHLDKPKFIIDDDSNKIGRFIYSIKIISFSEFEELLKNNDDIQKVIFSIPSISSFEKEKIENKFNNLKIDFFNIPSFLNQDLSINDIINNINKKSKNFKEEIGDNVKKYFEKKSILITGAGGSIGKEICYKVSKLDINKLVVVDNDEYRLSKLNRELNLFKDKIDIHDYLIDINNFEDINKIFVTHKPDIVFHAAASKHVDLVEKNWFFGSMNNINSTRNICECSEKNKVKKTIFISTDKAVEPINFLGLSKSAGEKIIKIFAAKNLYSEYSTVRFGNVIGSSGSLLDTIKDQLKISNTINVTDKNMTRYFMTISDAVSLVLVSSSISKNSDCHVLNMGDPVKIIDIVNNIIKQKNLDQNNEDQNIKIKFIGKRPGEKIHEKLFYDNSIQKTSHELIFNEKRNLNINLDINLFISELKNKRSNVKDFKNQIINFIN